MVPKSAAPGDEIVIYIREYGFFATALVKSQPCPRTDWKNRYRADVDSIKLVQPPISLAAIRRYVLLRADGRCEGCLAAAPFRGTDGRPFLETHHTTRVADDGPDDPRTVIGICPNCHRRAHLAEDAQFFNASLIKKLPELEAAVRTR